MLVDHDDEGNEDHDALERLSSSVHTWWEKKGQTYAISWSSFYQQMEHIPFVSSAWFEGLGAELTQRVADLEQQRVEEYRDSANKQRAQTQANVAAFAKVERYARAGNGRQR